MLTPREAALGAYNARRSTGTGTVLGGDMAEVTAARLAQLDRVAALIDRALGTPRIFVAEPSDDRLHQMHDHIARIRADVATASSG